jgi:oxygen-independent coproporphyrinogen III oxidase
MLLYIHIPFCDSKCHYCSFNSYVELFSYKKVYLEALKKQLKFELKKYTPKIETIFIGGGTPSTIDGDEYKDILEIIEPYFANKDIEITIEANPNSASDVWLKKVYNSGVNRISFGVQSFNDEKLRLLGRNHNKNQAIKAINNAKEVGFLHINSDIIYDTKIDTKELLETDLKIIESLPIDHISCYSLTIEEGTKFYTQQDVQVEDEKRARELFQSLSKLGYEQYEISNFALNNKAKSKHNLGYWQYKEYLGIGAGAVGYVDGQRYYPFKDLFKYIETPLEYEDIEKITDKDQQLEKLFLGLRSEVGVDISVLDKNKLENIKELEQVGKIVLKNNRLYNQDFLLADELALFFDK